jgi:hypothetical protein
LLEIPEEILREMIAMIPEFRRRLSFKGFENKITDVIRDEFGIDIKDSRGYTEINGN